MTSTCDGKLPPGMFRVGRKLYGVCAECGHLVRIKRILGGLHICVEDHPR